MISRVGLSFTYGQSLTKGDPVYLKSDGAVWKADADDPAKLPCIGLAMETAVSGVHKIMLLGVMKNDDWAWTIGSPVYLSTSSGLTQVEPTTPGDVLQIIGHAQAANRILVCPGPATTIGLADGDYGAILVTGDGADVAIADTAVTRVTLTEAPGTDATATGIIVSLTYGESLVPGDPVYIKSDGAVWKADANSAGKFPADGIALDTGSSGSRRVLLNGIMRLDSWAWTVGGTIYLSTSGGLTQTAPSTTDDCVQVMGKATHADRMRVNPSPDYITVV